MQYILNMSNKLSKCVLLALLDCVSRANAVAQASVVHKTRFLRNRQANSCQICFPFYFYFIFFDISFFVFVSMESYEKNNVKRHLI